MRRPAFGERAQESRKVEREKYSREAEGDRQGRTRDLLGDEPGA